MLFNKISLLKSEEIGTYTPPMSWVPENDPSKYYIYKIKLL